ncbi:MAG: hydroxymethylglutaryl-CoA reductase, degradative [Chloroflexi bacterium]|nr:hydroxymethylglutaryl-CoA reductase, degradative [Chloroflexota bacterium]
MTATSRLPGFYDKSLAERGAEIARLAGLSPEELAALDGSAGLTPAQADHMIENVIGVHGLPLGVATNFLINGREVLVPLAVPEMIGQMQILDVADVQAARLRLLEKRDWLLEIANGIDPVIVGLGGGARELEVRVIEQSPIGPFLVAHLIYDTRAAMGANAVNTVVERLAPPVEGITGGRVHLRILSNLADRRLARARCTVPVGALAFDEYSGERVRDGIIEAWAFAAADPYRAATHNKGIMNGVDAVVIATGNDWRAVEAGAHAYAARSGRYTSLSTWGKDREGNLVGTLEMPLAVGTVGGATKVHPSARAALKLMGVGAGLPRPYPAAWLAEVIVSVGLAQNLAALRALATEGIQRGHMGLHARQVAIAAGATGEQIERVAGQMAAEKNVR